MWEAFKIPNMTSPETPVGDMSKAVEVRKWGEPRKVDWKMRDHVELGYLHNLFDFEAGSKVTGSKFVYLKNMAAMLELKLVSWAMEGLRTQGYTPVITPDLSRNEIISGCGFNPRDPSS
jgi:seryl-tRNA synthetase